MERLKMERKPVRAAVTRSITILENGLKKDAMDRLELEAAVQSLERQLQRLADLDDRMKDVLLDTEGISPEEFESEYEAIEEYQKKATLAKVKVNAVLFNNRGGSPVHSLPENALSTTSSSHRKRSFRLPKTELRKFSGELTEWLGWWASFEKIHLDEDIDTSDKFEYLYQSMVEGTRPHELINGYPRSNENYPKVIKILKERYGKPKLLKQVYVRELISMILLKNREKVVISSLYDKLESHLRSLESLGVTVEQTVEFLFPMVESSLPEDILLAWQRSPNFGVDGTRLEPQRTELDFLMTFLKQEIDNEEHRKLARSGFTNQGDKKKLVQKKKEVTEEEDLPTSVGLYSGSDSKPTCIFCEKSHESSKCYKAQRMSADEKKGKVHRAGACFICLKRGHISKKCRIQAKCSKCGKRHSELFCTDSISSKTQECTSGVTTTIKTNLNCTSEVLLRTLMVEVQNPVSSKKKAVRVLIDCGSQRSYILKKTARCLGLVPMKTMWMNHELFGGTEVSGQCHKVFKAILHNPKDEFKTEVLLMDQCRICGTLPRVTTGRWVSELEKAGILLGDSDNSNNVEIEILLGADVLGGLLTGNTLQLENGLTATHTRLGWTLMGKQKSSENLALSALTMTVSSSTVTELWNLESIGIRDPIETATKEERERKAHQHFLETVSQNSLGRFSVSLPWTNGEINLPSNKEVAFKRLETTTKKLISLNKIIDYDEVFRSWETEGIISKVEAERENRNFGCHYLPHRAVFKDSKTTPVRPVFDASSKIGRSPCLNDCLEKGPNLLELIPSILLRFRMGKIGVIADIRKAFLMIEVNEMDRDYLRFLWWEDHEWKIPKVYRHNRVVFGMNCSPFLLAAVIGYHLKQQCHSEQATIQQIENSLYVDNLVTSVDDITQFEKLKDEATKLMSSAQMELRQWERTGDGEGSVTNVLGLKWNKNEDSIFCVILPAEMPLKVTKRVILSEVQRIYDPLGFLSPILITPKILLQKAWSENKRWDEEISDEIKREFLIWWQEIQTHISHIRLPRTCTRGEKLSKDNSEIHCFSDASQDAYAAAVFLRVEAQSGVSVQLLQSKTRVAPMRASTIPRLELLSCTIAARLTSTVRKALLLEDVPVTYWNDSSTALAWIRQSDDWGTFVGNRVKEICRLTNVEDWKHIPGTDNPADLPSRGVRPRKFSKIRWWEGPDWLKMSHEHWPSGGYCPNQETVEKEKRKTVKTNLKISLPPFYVRKNSYMGNLRIMTFVFRFIDKCRKGSGNSRLPPIVDEINHTELRIFKLIQTQCFAKEDVRICGVKTEKDSTDVIRVKTKLLNRQDSMEFKRPILLPNAHPMVELLIREEHICNSHCGAQILMGILREKVWILQTRKAIKRVLHSCVVCRRFDSQKSHVPSCALPEDRVKDASAFQVTGIDLAGPLVLKNKNKVWIVLFTCGVYRCVHLELVQSVSTEDFLLAFIRFCKRKRRPETVYTDNGTNFVGSVNLFNQIDWDVVEKRTQQKRVRWIFNPPSAPWWGGWWERLIRSVKDLLKRMLGFQKLRYIELETCLCEVEYMVNNRPLTFVTEDSDDLIPITPAMFVHALPEEEVPELKLLKVDTLQAKKKRLDKLLGDLKNRFRKEYLGQLVQRGKDTKCRQFKVGEVVLIERDDQKRILWPMGRILELIPGKDGFVRTARLKTKTNEILRPIQRLFPLEVTPEESEPIMTAAIQRGQKVEVAIPVQRTSSGRQVRPPVRFCDY